MSKIINLRQARKAKERKSEEAQAAVNRVQHGTSKRLRAAAKNEKDRAARIIGAHQLEKKDR